MQVVALNWHVYVLTGSPLALGLVGLTRVLPIIVFSLWGGIVADRVDRRRIMLVSQSRDGHLVGGAGVPHLPGRGQPGRALCAQRGHGRGLRVRQSRPAGAGAAPGAAGRAAERARPEPRHVHAAFIGGPGLAGLLLAGGGATMPGAAARAVAGAEAASLPVIAAIYAVNALSFLAVIVALLFMRTNTAPEPGTVTDERPLESLKAGLRFVFTTPIMVWTMGLDFVATFFAGVAVAAADLRGPGPPRRAPPATAGWWPRPRWARCLGSHLHVRGPSAAAAGPRAAVGGRRLRRCSRSSTAWPALL